MTHVVQQFEEFQWRQWLREPLQVANMQVANGVWEAGLRPPRDFHVEFFLTDAKRPDLVAWMTVECGNPCWSAVAKMVVCNWQKTSGRRARALAASKVWHGRENEDHDLLRCMWACTAARICCLFWSTWAAWPSWNLMMSFYSFGLLFGWVSSDMLECWSTCFWAPWVPTPLEITTSLWPRLMEHQGLHRV